MPRELKKEKRNFLTKAKNEKADKAVLTEFIILAD